MNFQSFTRLSGTVFVTLLIASTAALAGGANGGGGLSIVCRNTDGSIKSAELVDLVQWEASGAYPRLRQIPATDSSVNNDRALETQIQILLNQPELQTVESTSLKKMLMRNIPVVLAKIKRSLAGAHPIAAGKYIFAQPDFGAGQALLVPDGCKPEYAFYYQSNGDLIAIPEIWHSFNITNRLAGVVHEAVYLLNRNLFGDHTAAPSRKDTAEIIAHMYDRTANSLGLLLQHNYLNIIAADWANTSVINLELDPNYQFNQRRTARIKIEYSIGPNSKPIETQFVSLDSAHKNVTVSSRRDHMMWTSVKLSLVKPFFNRSGLAPDIKLKVLDDKNDAIETGGTWSTSVNATATLEKAYSADGGDPYQLMYNSCEYDRSSPCE